MTFHGLFLCKKYSFDKIFGDPNSTCIIRAYGKGVILI